MAASLAHAFGRAAGETPLPSAAGEGTNGKRGRRRTAPASPSAITAGASVIVLRDDTNSLHLPAQYMNGLHIGMSLDEFLHCGGTPVRWPTLCGRIGDVFLFHRIFRRRDVCPRCRETESAA